LSTEENRMRFDEAVFKSPKAHHIKQKTPRRGVFCLIVRFSV